MMTELFSLIILLTLFAMPAVADDVDRWIQDLQDPSSSVREAAAENLGDLGNTRAVGPLIKALSDTDSEVRGWAVYALGDLNDTRAVDPLILALNDTAPNVRGYAALSLGQLGDTRAVDPLIQTLSAKDSDDRASAAQALGELKDPRAVNPLILSLKDGNSDVRWCAAEALGKLNDTRVVGPLIQALKDEEYMVRGRAAEALGNLGDTRAIEPLIPSLKDKDEYVQSAAKDALTKLGWQQGNAQGHDSSHLGAYVIPASASVIADLELVSTKHDFGPGVGGIESKEQTILLPNAGWLTITYQTEPYLGNMKGGPDFFPKDLGSYYLEQPGEKTDTPPKWVKGQPGKYVIKSYVNTPQGDRPFIVKLVAPWECQAFQICNAGTVYAAKQRLTYEYTPDSEIAPALSQDEGI